VPESKDERLAIQHPREGAGSVPSNERLAPGHRADTTDGPDAAGNDVESDEERLAIQHPPALSETAPLGPTSESDVLESAVPFLPSRSAEPANGSRAYHQRLDDPPDSSSPLQISMAAAADVPLHAYGGPTNPIDGGTLALQAPSTRLAQVREELVAWVKTLISAAVYAILIVTFGFQVARVEGQSMAPTLEDQDRLIVNKLVYRIGEPRRGDIVMLYYPLNPEKSFVKRVIAEEGDTVRIVDGRVYVNDIPLKDDYVPSEFRSHDDWGPQVIPEGYYFVMGDHRNNSSDSRHWGMVPKKYIIGKVQLRWWPVPSARVF
jgi:signal peptidase I